MSNPLVSVILARTYGEEFPTQARASLEAQTFPDFEIIISQPRQSIAAARNQAVQAAQGAYLAFIDSAQRWAPQKLARQMHEVFEQSSLNWCYCDATIGETRMRSSETTPLHSGDILRPLLLKNFIPAGSVVVRRSVFEALGGFNISEAFQCSEEWDMWLRIAAHHPAGLVADPLVQLPYESGVSDQRQLSMKRVVEDAVARHERQLKDLRSESLAEICVCAGNALLKANQRDEARSQFAEALTHSPLRSDAYLCWAASFLSSEAQQQIRDLHNLGRNLQPGEKNVQKETQALK